MSTAALKRSVFLVANLVSFLTAFVVSAINLVMPAIAREMAMDAVLMGWVATSYLLALAMFLLPWGRLGDIYGRKKIFTYGIAVYTLASLLCALAHSPALLIASRALQGIGAAMIAATAVAILTSVHTPQERGRVLGWNVATVYIGLSAGPFLGGILVQQWGWRSIFGINALLGLIILGLVGWQLKGEWRGAEGERFDWIGALIYGPALAAMIYGFSTITKMVGVLLLLAGVLGLAAFVWWTMRAPFSLLNLNLFRGNPTFVLSNLAALISYSATFATTYLLSLYVQYIHGLTPQAAGVVLVAQPAMQSLFSPLAGRLSDRVPPRLLAAAGMSLTVIGLFSLAFLGTQTPLWFVVAILALLGIGFALFSSPNTSAIMGSVERRLYGVASATAGTMRSLGQTFSMGIATLIFSIYVGRTKITSDLYPQFLSGVQTTFAVLAILCLVGIWAAGVRREAKG